jgi:hypothetical protein
LNFLLQIAATTANLIWTILSRFLLGANLLCQSFNSFAGKRVSPAVESLYQLHIKWGVRPIPPLLYKVTAAQEGTPQLLMMRDISPW